MSLRVAAIQLALGLRSYRRTVDRAVDLIRQSASLGSKIVCLPEHWLLEYREEAYGVTEELADVARDQRIFVISGANYMPVESDSPSRLKIRSALIGPDGTVLGHQDKVHLFHAEKEVATPGDRYEVFHTSIGRVGITICYDNVFPEACRTLALKGAEVVFVPSRIVHEGIDPWILYLRTRALENRIPIVAPNVFDPPRYVGGSVIIDLMKGRCSPVVIPRIVASARSGESVLTADIDFEGVEKMRKERLSERRPNAYER